MEAEPTSSDNEKTMAKLMGEITTIKMDIKDLKKRLDEVISTLSKFSEQPYYSISTKESKGLLKGRTKFSEEKVAQLFACLSNSGRLRILLELSQEAKYFSELLESTKITHSPLRFHLINLLNAGYIMQERKRGKYFITRKGKNALQIVGRIAVGGKRKISKAIPTAIPVREFPPDWSKTITETETQPKIYS